MVDLSAQGTKVTITFGDKKAGKGGVVWENRKILVIRGRDLSDQGEPVSVGRVPASQLDVDLNGNAVVSRQVSPIRLSLSLIPNSRSDRVLRAQVYVARSGKGAAALVELMKLEYTNGTTVTYLDGTVSVGAVSPGISTEGRLAGGNYEFVFAGLEKPGEKQKN